MVSKRKSTGKVKKKVATKEKKKVVRIKDLGKSMLVEDDLKATERKLRFKEPEHLKEERQPRLFYRKFVFRCEKCVHEFEHESTIPIIEHIVTCPSCREEHRIRVIPVSKYYEIKLPKNLKALKKAR
jgi:Zn finger protein HypA/HybF involved in hydrogenase expression